MAELKIKPSQIKIGYAIKLPCSWMEHPFLAANFVVENVEQIDIIRSLSLDFVFFYPEKSIAQSETTALRSHEPAEVAVEKDSIIAAREKLLQQKQQRIEAAKAHRAAFQKTEKAFHQTLGQVKALMQTLASRPLNAIEDSKVLINQMTQTILGAESLVLHVMSNGGQEAQNFHSHSLNVSVLSMLLAEKMGLNEDEVQAVGMGALFHDIGKIKIPSQITRKKTPLTSPELNLLKMHPRYGIELVDLIAVFPSSAKVVIEQHHEYADGTGYPSGLKGENIHPFSKIVTVTNEFDNLCHPVDEAKARTPHHALSFMFTHMKAKFHHETLAVFIKLMGIYPPGTIVQLSDGRLGIVMSSHAASMTQPEVLIYDPEVPRLEAPLVTLDRDLKIEKVANIREIAPEIVLYLNPRAQNSYYFDPMQG
jgi:putative nucleotidyltransferase with HDIG domain